MNKNDIPYFETSAKESINVEEAFQVLSILLSEFGKALTWGCWEY